MVLLPGNAKGMVQPSSLGQASAELLIILGISLLLILLFSAFSADLISDLGAQSNVDDAQDSVSRLAAAADAVYAQGEGATIIVQVKIPENAVLNSSVTYIGRPTPAGSSLAPTRINIRVGDTDVYASTSAPLVGSFPTAPGNVPMRVESKGSYVAVGTHLLDTSIQSIFKSMARNEQRNQSVTFCKAANGSVNVSMQYGWAFPNVALNVTPTNFTIISPPCTAVSVQMLSNGLAGGLYNTDIQVSALSDNFTERFTIPVTVDVQVG